MIATGVAYLVWMLLGFTIGVFAFAYVVAAGLQEIGMYDEVMDKMRDHLDGMK